MTITVNEEPLPVLNEPVISLSSETSSAKGIQTLSISHTNGEGQIYYSLKYEDFIILHYHSEDPDNMGNKTIDFVDVSDPANPHSVALLEVEPYAVMGLVGDYLVVGENNLNVYSLAELTDSTDDIYLAASLEGDHSSWGKWGFTGDVNSADEMYIYITRDDWDFSDEPPVMTIIRASR